MLPSGPAVMPCGEPIAGSVSSVIAAGVAGLKKPIAAGVQHCVNHMFPSGPGAMSSGPENPLGSE